MGLVPKLTEIDGDGELINSCNFCLNNSLSCLCPIRGSLSQLALVILKGQVTIVGSLSSDMKIDGKLV